MESELLSIGELARASGLSTSALRFYDRSGVLRPAHVDSDTGYRWYTTGQVRAARVAATLRRVAMPVTEIGRVLTGPAAVATALVDGHLRRLETGLADAQRELSRVRELIAPEEIMTTCTVAAADLAGALHAVRYAAGSDPELPMLAGVLVELGEGLVRLIATDRYRLAVAAAPCVASPGDRPTVSVASPGDRPTVSVASPRGAVGTPVRAIAPTSFIDEVGPLLDTAPTVDVVVDAGRITVRAGDREVSTAVLPYDFPDYRRLLPAEATRRVPVNASRLREDLAAAGVGPVAVLSVGADGTVGVETGGPVAGAARIGVNPQFLSQALAAAGDRRIMLELREPAEPMVLRPAGGAGDVYSLLMPIRLDGAPAAPVPPAG